ncbi:MAG: hypothetical protein ACFFCO_10695, partial [Promethearchaeota archaeon]
MIQRKTHLVITGFCIVLLLLAASGSLSPERPRRVGASEEVPLPGFSTYNEYFFTTTFANLSATTAAGWGDGFLETPRDLAGHFGQLDHFASSAPIRSVDVQDHKVYVTRYVSSAETIQCLDISDPSNIVKLSGRTSRAYLISGEVEGDMFFAGIKNRSSYQGRIVFYNVCRYDALSGSGVELSEIITNGDPTAFDVQGHFLYVLIREELTDIGDTFRIIDIENITHVVQVGAPTIQPNYGLGLVVEGQIAYVANDLGGLALYNISNPYAPNYIRYKA